MKKMTSNYVPTRADILTELTKRCVNESQKIILDILAESSAMNRVSRSELCEKLHTPDRVVRQEIASMRKNGVFIAGDVRRAGYFLPENYEEFLAFEDNYGGRALTTLYTKGRMHALAEGLFFGQIDMEERDETVRD